jgi:hypothetical protein
MHNARTPNDAGFTIAETMVSLALTGMVIGSALSALLTTARLTDTARIMSDTNQSIEVGMSLMTRDFIQAGEAIPRGGIPLPSGAGVGAIKRPGPIGAALTFDPTWTTLPAVVPGAQLGPIVLGVRTDALTLLYADPTLPINQVPLDAIAADGSSMTVNAATPITGVGGLAVGDLILFVNSNGSALQMITRVNGNQTVNFAGGDPMNLNQRAAPSGSLMQLQQAAGVFPLTTAMRVLMVTYFVDTVTDPTLPRLARQVNLGPPLAIAIGAENLQFTFDLIDGVTNPANVEIVAAPNSPNQIRKINIFLSARSIDVDHQTGQFFRNSTATDVALRSLSFVNRYQ